MVEEEPGSPGLRFLSLALERRAVVGTGNGVQYKVSAIAEG